MKQFLLALALGTFVCFLNESFAINITLGQKIQNSWKSDPNISDLKEALELRLDELKIKRSQEYPQEVNEQNINYLSEAEIEKIIAQHIEAKNIFYKDSIFGNSFKGLAMSISPIKEEYDISEEIKILILIKNFSQEKLELKYLRGNGDMEEFKYAMYFSDGSPVSKSGLIETYIASINNLKLPRGLTSNIIYSFEPMRIWESIIEIGRFFKIEKEGTYTLVVMRRLTHTWDDGFMISNITKINIVNKKEEN